MLIGSSSLDREPLNIMLQLRKLAARTPVMTIAELAKEPEFGELTPSQRATVLAFCENPNDPVAAIQAGYNTPSKAAAQRLMHDIFKRPKILRALRLYYGVSAKAEFIRELDAAIANPRITVAKVRAMELYAKTMGWVPVGAGGRPPKGEAKAATRKFRLGEHVLLSGRECAVTKIDEDGRPVEVEPVKGSHES